MPTGAACHTDGRLRWMRLCHIRPSPPSYPSRRVSNFTSLPRLAGAVALSPHLDWSTTLTTGRYHTVPHHRAAYSALDLDPRPTKGCEQGRGYTERRSQGPVDRSTPTRYPQSAEKSLAPRQAARVVSLYLLPQLQPASNTPQPLQADATTRHSSTGQSCQGQEWKCRRLYSPAEPFCKHATETDGCRLQV
jgi:hypothetical protein